MESFFGVVVLLCFRFVQYPSPQVSPPIEAPQFGLAHPPPDPPLAFVIRFRNSGEIQIFERYPGFYTLPLVSIIPELSIVMTTAFDIVCHTCMAISSLLSIVGSLVVIRTLSKSRRNLVSEQIFFYLALSGLGTSLSFVLYVL